MNIQIFDLDNCLADDTHRLHLIDWNYDNPIPRYHAYNLAAVDDSPDNLHLILPQCKLVIFSGRPEFYLDLTTNWLAAHNIVPAMVFMRREDDFRPASIVKRDMLEGLIKTQNLKRSDIFCAYDDQEDIINMYQQSMVAASHLFIRDPSLCRNPKQ